MALPKHTRVVIVGGGIIGCSVAYHLALMGCTDVVLLEQGKLSAGTTWHAAGLVGQLRPNRPMTAMSRYGIELYARLEQETGLATGWKACGSLYVAQTSDRLRMMMRQASLARRYGVHCEAISPREAADHFPLMRSDDLAGALWLPEDGKVNPADLCAAIAKGARQRGVLMFEGIRAIAVHSQGQGRLRRVCGLRVRGTGIEQDIGCELLVNCAGQWARQFAAGAGVSVPLHAAEHFYIVTGKIAGVHPMLPVMRDPDSYIYYKEEVGGLLMGGFEPSAKPWKVDPIPDDFQFQLLNEDWDQFEVLMKHALHRTPCLEKAQIKMLLNGPESFTPDGNFIMGEAPELRHYFVCAGFNSSGIANSAGAGKMMAAWMLEGDPGMDVSALDIRRFSP
ncbi:MAG: FAD-binding oxidoreductase, partial [Betaproteobacteria bacterium]|nr:FAD-binding oxidoreductase [Betaproteobacteria bacterium]